MKARLSTRQRALVECAPVDENPSADRSMRAALDCAQATQEEAARLTTQQRFDQALAKVARRIALPKEADEWALNLAATPAGKTSWLRTVRQPAILAIALAFFVITGLGIFFFVDQLHAFPGSTSAKKLLVAASKTNRSDLEPLHTDAINLGDYFFMKFRLEHCDVPMALADLRATGARVFEDEDGRRVAQVALAESGLQFFFYPAEPGEASRASRAAPNNWRFVEAEGWTGAVEEHDGVCLLVALHGGKGDLRPYLSGNVR